MFCTNKVTLRKSFTEGGGKVLFLSLLAVLLLASCRNYILAPIGDTGNSEASEYFVDENGKIWEITYDGSGELRQSNTGWYLATPDTAQEMLDKVQSGENIYFSAGTYPDTYYLRATRTTATAYDQGKDDAYNNKIEESAQVEIDELKINGRYHYVREMSDIEFRADENAVFTGMFKIENEYWYISYNNGESWEQLGKATGEDGTSGDSMFTDIDYKTSTDYVIFTLADGTQIKLPTWSAFEALQRLCNETNTNLSSLQAIVTALQNNDYITSVDPLTENGKVVGYTIKFAKSNPIVIYNGKDGADGNTPVIGIKKDTDGIYYWTLDGEFILADGHKIQAQGNDGITPKLEIRNGYWWVSYDNGQNWEQLGKATGEDGKDGESIKITQDENNVYFELEDGTVITISKTESSGSSGPENPSDNINFYSINTKYVCVKNWDINGDNELSYEEAAAVKTMDNVIDGTKIDVFDEFQYFINITSVKASVFSTNLRSIILPKSIINIEDQAFRGCKNLSQITLSANLTSIGNEAFSGCTNLSGDLVVPSNVTNIGQQAFGNCYNINSLDLSQATNLTTIGNYAFYDCKNLTGDLVIPSSVQNIGDYAFRYANITSLDLSQATSLTTIGSNSFSGSKLTGDLVIPSSVQNIGDYAFRNTKIDNLYFLSETPPSFDVS